MQISSQTCWLDIPYLDEQEVAGCIGIRQTKMSYTVKQHPLSLLGEPEAPWTEVLQYRNRQLKLLLLTLIASCTFQYPVQNTISDNTNVLWNSPSLGKSTAIGYPWFYKTTLFLSFEGEKTGSNSPIFFWYSPLFGMRQKQPTISGIALF